MQDAVVVGETRTTYGALRDRAAACASVLRTGGVRPGERVGLLLERGPDAAAAFFGVLAAGGVVININATPRPRQGGEAGGSLFGPGKRAPARGQKLQAGKSFRAAPGGANGTGR